MRNWQQNLLFETYSVREKSLPCGLSLTFPYSLQQFLYFFPLPHGQGSLRPTFFSTILGLGGFSNRVKSEISSDFLGLSILYFHLLALRCDPFCFLQRQLPVLSVPN
jgi:hypothetical protein